MKGTIQNLKMLIEKYGSDTPIVSAVQSHINSNNK